MIPKWDGGDGNAGAAKVAFFVGKGGIKPKDPFGTYARGRRFGNTVK